MRRMTGIAVVMLGAWLGGCKSSDSPIFFTSPMSPYPDVPMPASFKLVTESAARGAPAGGRSMERSYESTDGLAPVAQFFREQLPRQGWVLQSDLQDAGRLVLKYSKPGETLQVDASAVSKIRTRATLRISPAGQ